MIQRESLIRRAWRLAGDLLVGCGAFFAAFWLRIHVAVPWTADLLPADRMGLFYRDALLIVLAQIIALYFFGLYDSPPLRRAADIGRRLLPAMGLQGLLLIAYYFFADKDFPRSVLVLFLMLNSLLLIAHRVLSSLRARPVPRRVVIVGSDPAARELAETIERHGLEDLVVAGWVPAPGEINEPDFDSGPLGARLGTVVDLPRLLLADEIDDVILAGTANLWKAQLLDRLADIGSASGSVLFLPGPFESLIGRMRFRWVKDLPLIEVVRHTEWRVRQPIKRLLDLAVGALLTIATLPLMILVALAIRITSPGPVFYTQTRVGKGFKPFTLWKFRTMRVDAENEAEEILAEPNDPRLTPIGATLRNLRLDELPQLVNVLAGSMSLIGPRPERPGFVDRFLREVPGYARRFAMAPGLSGLAQVNGDYHSSPQNKLRYDLAYLANWSLWLDLSILIRTVKIVLTSRGT